MSKKQRASDLAIMCGPAGRVTATSLTKAERKTIDNFGSFLRGKGTRCPHCLHKAKKHRDGLNKNPVEQECLGEDCDCQASAGWVRRWWKKRLDGER